MVMLNITMPFLQSLLFSFFCMDGHSLDIARASQSCIHFRQTAQCSTVLVCRARMFVSSRVLFRLPSWAWPSLTMLTLLMKQTLNWHRTHRGALPSSTCVYVWVCVWGRTWVSARGGCLPLEGGSVAAVGAQGWRARSEADGSWQKPHGCRSTRGRCGFPCRAGAPAGSARVTLHCPNRTRPPPGAVRTHA